MKKIIILGLALTLMVAATACGGDTKATSAATTAAPATTAGAETTAPATTAGAETTAPAGETTAAKGDGTINLVLDDGSLVYKKFELAEDYAGKPVIITYFSYTNTGKTSSAAYLQFRVNAYQDGIEGGPIAVMKTGGEPKEVENSRSQVKPGATVDVAFISLLSDTTTDVELTVGPLISFDDKDTQTQIIKIAE